MRLRNITLAGVILLVLVFTIGMAGATENGTGNETPTVTATGSPTETLTVTPTATPEADDDDAKDDSLIGPGNALYGLKIAFENIGEVFIFNASEKLGKQVSHARKRIAEARAALKRDDTEAANKALAEYGTKINDVNGSMSKLSGQDTGFIYAQQMILKHQLILKNLSISHANSTGLQRAYNNSKNLQNKFASKTVQKLDLNSTKDNREIPKVENKGVSIKDAKTEKGNKRSN